MHYCCRADSHNARRVLPWSFLIAGIINILLIIWVLIFILAIYDHDKLYSIRYEKGEEDEVTTNNIAIHYTERKKAYYIFWHVLGEFGFAIIFIIFFFTAKDWVDKHKD